jgi:RNB-like family protein
MLKIGNIVLYKDRPALIRECADKYTIEYAIGTQKVREKDICLLHEGPLPSLSALLPSAQKDEERDVLNAALNEAWELLQDENRPSFSLAEIAELAFGGFVPEKSWVIYDALAKHPHFLLVPPSPPEQPRFSLRSSEEAQKLLVKQDEKKREKEERSAFIERLRKKRLLLPQDGVFMGEVEALALGKTDKSKIMQEAGMSASPEKAHKLLLDCGIWTIYRNPHPSRWGLSTQSATERLRCPQESERTKVDHIAYAIDSEWSTDPDDAIAFDGTYVWVHIADPADTVLPDSAIDKAARERGATLYIPEGASRMLAEESLSDYALGLPENGEGAKGDPYSRALSFRIKLNDDGAIEETAVLKTKVRVHRLTYAQADAQSSGNLAALFKIADKNIERRKAAGAVFIQMPEVHISLEYPANAANGEPAVRIEPIMRCRSAELVREFMLLAGEAAARFAFKNAIPFPFVCQEKPEIPRSLSEGLAGQYRLRRCMKSRTISTSPLAHAGLGLGMYSQVTSPLRRYGDLAAHEQLHAFLDGRPLLSKDSLLERISEGDAAASAAVKAERKSNLHWTLVYLLQHKDSRFEAVIVDIKENQAVVIIPALAQEALIPLVPGKTLNDTVYVQAAGINIPELTATYVPVKEA